MKRLILLTLICTGFVGCGHNNNSPCTSPLVANWKSTTNESLNISSNSLFTFIANDGCDSSGTYICPGTASSGAINITVTTAATGNCLPVGNYNCSFTYNNVQLTLQCASDYPVYYFEKQ